MVAIVARVGSQKIFISTKMEDKSSLTTPFKISKMS